MIFGKPFRKKWYLRLCVCLVSDSFLAWHLKITQHSQQTSKQRTFLKERVKKWQNNTFASNVYICVLVFIINQHNGWKVLIYEIQIKKIHYPSTSFLKGCRPSVMALDFNYFENRPSEQLHSYFLPCYKLQTNREKEYKFILFLELACQKRGVIMDVLHFHRRLVPDRRATSLTFGFVSFSDFLRVWKISSLSFCRRGSLVLELLSSSFLFLFCSYWVIS